MEPAEPLRLRALFADYPQTLALKTGAVRSASLAFDFADVKVAHTAFKRVVRDLEFDVAELALVTFLMAKAWGKPLLLLPAVISARFQHPYLVYNAERGYLAPADLVGRRVGIRSYSVTTAAWIRGILADDYGVEPERVHWVGFEDPHVAEFRDPPMVERAAAGKDMLAMLLAGELDAAVLANPLPADPRLKPVIPDPAAKAKEWHQRNRAIQVNHMVVVRDTLPQSHPEAVQEIFRLLLQSKHAAGLRAAHGIDLNPFGVEANRRNLELAIDCCYRQRLIPRPLAVHELFDDVTRALEV